MLKRKGPYFPIEHEPRIDTLDRPIIIESAFPGWLPLAVNPHIPIKTEAVAREIVDSVKAGAAAVHVHPRDPDDGLMRFDPPLLKRTLDMVFEECPDVYTSNHSWYGVPTQPIDYKQHTQELLELGNGPRYVEGSTVLITGNPTERDRPLFGDSQAVKEGVPYLESNNIKPLFNIYDTHGIHWLTRELIDTGIAKWEPFVCYLHMGKHHSTSIFKDPWAHLQLITSLYQLKAAIPGCIVGLRAGGRNWLPVTVTALTLGVDIVSVGMEDCLWMYPHRDEIMTKNSEVIRKVATFARELGRDIATPEDIRVIFNQKTGARVKP